MTELDDAKIIADQTTWTRRLQAITGLLIISSKAAHQDGEEGFIRGAMGALHVLGVTKEEMRRCVKKMAVASSMDPDAAVAFLLPDYRRHP